VPSPATQRKHRKVKVGTLGLDPAGGGDHFVRFIPDKSRLEPCRYGLTVNQRRGLVSSPLLAYGSAQQNDFVPNG